MSLPESAGGFVTNCKIDDCLLFELFAEGTSLDFLVGVVSILSRVQN